MSCTTPINQGIQVNHAERPVRVRLTEGPDNAIRSIGHRVILQSLDDLDVPKIVKPLAIRPGKLK